MDSYIEVKDVYLRCFDGVHNMVHARIIDRIHKIDADVLEWVDENNHVDRCNSVIMDSYLIEASFDTLLDIFDAIDWALDDLAVL